MHVRDEVSYCQRERPEKLNIGRLHIQAEVSVEGDQRVEQLVIITQVVTREFFWHDTVPG